jgi:mono/diheme cytochrome c family protein
MLTKKLSCPSCDAALKIASSVPAGKMITCPKCGIGFPVSAENATGRDERKEDIDERPLPRRKFRKKQRSSGNMVGIVVLVLGILLFLGAGGALAVVLLVVKKKPEAVAVNNPVEPERTMPAGGAPAEASGASTTSLIPRGNADSGASDPAAGKSPGFGGVQPPTFGPGQPAPESRGTGQAAAPNSPSVPDAGNPTPPVDSGSGSAPGADTGISGGDKDEFAAGKKVFAQTCSRCHSIDSAGASSGRGGPGMRRGPDLSNIGNRRSADWLTKFIRNPRSQKPNSQMPAFDRIPAGDLRSLVQYLTSLRG